MSEMDRETPHFEIPDDMLPPFVEVSPELCTAHSFFGWESGGAVGN